MDIKYEHLLKNVSNSKTNSGTELGRTEKTCKIACEVEEILYEINQYPGKITCCENINDFFDTLVLGDFDGFNIYATIDFWYDNEQSDLSMECYAEFYGRLLKSITLNKVHVF